MTTTDDHKHPIYYNPPGIDQSDGTYTEYGFPDVENINLGSFNDRVYDIPRFVIPGMKEFEPLRAWAMLAGSKEEAGETYDFWTLHVSWNELRQMMEGE